MKMRNLKNRIVALLIVALIFNESVYAGQFFFDNGVKKYVDEKGNLVTGWRWIDTNNDNIAECYRFGDDGALATKSVVKGKEVNAEGQWVIDGVVQRIYKSTGRPLYSANAALGEKDTNKYFDLGTYSSIKRINATSKKNLQDLITADLNKDEEDYKKSLIGPKAEFVKPKEGYVLSRSARNIVSKRPIATQSTWKIIDDALKEEEIRYLSATESIVAGRDMRKFVTASNKYTEKATKVKIYGGEIWEDAMVLQGNGAYVKFVTTEDKSKYQANYFTVEIAHQAHGESTADTYCAVELLLNGKSVETYDEFCDGEPEVIAEWLDDGETTVEFRAIVTGDAPGRKIYLRNARYRRIKVKESS